MILAVSFGAVGTLIAALVHVELRGDQVAQATIRRMDIAMAAAIAIPTVVMAILG